MYLSMDWQRHNMTTISIYDHSTGETTVRDLTEQELAELALVAEAEAARLAEEALIAEEAALEIATAKEALLERLGITAEEAALLLA